MLTKEQIYNHIRGLRDDGLTPTAACQEALAKFASPEHASSMLLDVLGVRAVMDFYWQRTGTMQKETLAGPPAEGDVQQASTPQISPQAIADSIFRTEFGILTATGKIKYVQLGDFTAETCELRVAFLKGQARGFLKKCPKWQALGARLGSKTFAEKFPTQAKANDVLKKVFGKAGA